MKTTLLSLKFWETVFAASLVLFLVDHYLLFSLFFITIPLCFLLGVVTCIFALREKQFLHMLLCILGICLPIAVFAVSF